ncbi:MAG: IPT/TIG domain-containing protein [Chloroflexi bacterium]|nr:IPT/TIG domain-containing protein [Chloroflexota bacterium]
MTPDRGQTGSSVTITVNGANFINGAKVLWNGTQAPTTFVSGSQLPAQVALAETGQAQASSVVVLNPDPAAQASNTAFFTVQAKSVGTSIFLPMIQR